MTTRIAPCIEVGLPRSIIAACIVACIAGSLVFMSAPAEAARAVLLVVDKLAVEDLVEFDEATRPLYERARLGATALMNVRTAGSADSANGYMSLAVGRRAVAPSWSGHAFAPTEIYQGRRARDVYESLTGAQAVGQAVHLGIGQLRSSYGAESTLAGILGQRVADAGMRTALIGTGDTPSERERLGALLAMNEAGTIDIARLDPDTLVNDPDWPTGMRTNYDGIRAALLETIPRAHLIVVDLPDLARLEAIAPYIQPPRGVELRRQTLQRIAKFVDDVLESVSEIDGEPITVYLLSPSPAKRFGRLGILVTPLFRWQKDSPGTLTSATTRRNGIVTNADFLPSLLSDLDLSVPSEAAGAPWRVRPNGNTLPELIRQYQSIRAVHLQRLPVIQSYFFLVLGSMAVGVALVLAVNRGYVAWNPRRNTLWKLLMVALAAFPVTLLLVSGFTPGTLYVTALRIAGLLLAVTLLSALVGRRHPWGAMGAVAIATSLLLIGDILTGAPLQQGSLLGYDPIAGSRYYGVGNEYMGTLMGATLISVALLLGTASFEKNSRSSYQAARFIWPSVVFTAVAALLLHPRLGINVGGAITAGSTAVAAYLLLRGRRITLGRGLMWAALIAAVLVIVGIVDFWISPRDASHLGQTVGRVAEKGADPLWDIVARKVAVNAKLIRLTVWSRVAILSLSLLGFLFLWPNWLSRTLERLHPSLVRMTRVSLVSALVALVFNDSGIVAAAMLLLWPALVTLYLAVDAAQRRKVSSS